MTFRSRRAHRELKAYLEGLYGPQASLAIREIRHEGAIRVTLDVAGTSAPRPLDDDDGQTHSAHSIDPYAPEHVRLVERLAARLVAIRSERYAPGGGLVPEDQADADYELHSDYPALFPLASLELGVAWLELVRAGTEILRAEDVLEGLVSSQVKSKFASLRWYFTGKPRDCTDEINAIIRALEHFSTVVCETCGAPGRHRRGGWHVIRCDPCQDVVDRDRKRRGGDGG